jgi:hypothetical protein
VRIAQHECVQQLIEDAQLDVRDEFRRERGVHRAKVVHPAKAFGEKDEGGVAQIGKAFFKPWIDGGGFLQNDCCGIAVGRDELEPVPEARPKQGARSLIGKGRVDFGAPRPSASSVRQDQQQIARLNDRADFHEQVGHHAVTGAVNRGFHLHRFDRQQGLACLHLLPCPHGQR